LRLNDAQEIFDGYRFAFQIHLLSGAGVERLLGASAPWEPAVRELCDEPCGYSKPLRIPSQLPDTAPPPAASPILRS
jgi:hypothetical protein